jgi:23S rRNA (guanosine2251-2'-O)-methyltransferase
MREKEMVFGLRSVLEAIESGRSIDKILLKKDMEGELSRELSVVLRGKLIPVQRVPGERLDRVTRKNHQGVIAFVSAVEYQRLEDMIPSIYEAGRDPFMVLLDGVTDVRNFGGIARTCECAGVDGVVLPSGGSVTVTSDAMKTSSGALNHLAVCKERTLQGAIGYLRSSGLRVIAASEKGSEEYTAVSYEGPIGLVLGGEEAGISLENLRHADHIVRIPQYGEIGSLNVSAAAAVIIYEAVRQRRGGLNRR